jgi:hypothetical protein
VFDLFLSAASKEFHLAARPPGPYRWRHSRYSANAAHRAQRTRSLPGTALAIARRKCSIPPPMLR